MPALERIRASKTVPWIWVPYTTRMPRFPLRILLPQAGHKSQHVPGQLALNINWWELSRSKTWVPNDSKKVLEKVSAFVAQCREE